MGRGSRVNRARRQQISRAAREIYSLARTRGLAVDQIQDQLLRSFPHEMAPGEARMHAMGWTAPVVREGLLALAAEGGHDAPALELIDVSRWLRGEHRPRTWLKPLCQLFQCHQAKLGWPAQGNEIAIDFTNRACTEQSLPKSDSRGTSKPVFLQFINPEILQLYGVLKHFPPNALSRLALLLSRYALLISDGILVMPASYLFEVPFIQTLLDNLAPIRDAGLLGFASPAPDLYQYAPAKRHEYRNEPNLFPAYFQHADDHIGDANSLIWIPRVLRSSAQDITAAWHAESHHGGLWDQLQASGRNGQSPHRSRVETEIANVPVRLEGRAFVARYVLPLIPLEFGPREETLVSLLISRSYLESYLDELEGLILCDTPLGHLDCGISAMSATGRIQRVSWRAIADALSLLDLREAVDDGLSLSDLIALRTEPPLRWLIDLVARAPRDTTGGSNRALLSAALRLSRHSPRLERRNLDGVRDKLWQLWDVATADGKAC